MVIPVVVGSSPISHPKAFSKTAPPKGAVLHSPGGVMSARAAVLGVAMAAMVAGCASGTSDKDVRARAPMRLFTPTKMGDVAKCLRNNLGNEATLVQMPAKNQAEIRIGQTTAAGEYQYAYLISLTAQPDGTALELRKTDTWFPQLTPTELEAEAKACAPRS